MKKKCFVIFATLLLAPALVFAVGSRQQSQGATQAASFLTPPGQLPIVTQPTTISLGLPNRPSVNDWYNNYLTRYVQQNTGITLRFELFPLDSDGITQFELMVASGQRLPDILSLWGPGNWRTHGENGVFIDLNPYYDRYAYFYNQAMDKLRAKYGNDSEVNRIKMKMSSSTGKRFGYPQYDNSLGDATFSNTFINTTWLTRLGLRMPTTTQELRDVLVAFRDRDPNGNGRRDEIPMMGAPQQYNANIINWLINAFVYWYPYGLFNVTDGRLWTPWTTEEYRNALRYISGLVSDGLLSELAFSATSDDLRALMNPPNDVFTVGVSAGHGTLLWNNGSSVVDNYALLPSVTGPAGANYTAMGFPGISLISFITKDAQYPDVAFRLLDFFTREETSMVIRWGQEGVDWTPLPAGSNLVNSNGLPARFTSPNTLWGSTSQNTNWNHTIGFFNIDNGPARVISDDWVGKRTQIYLNQVSLAFGKQPKDMVDDILYTEEEWESIRELQNTINTYVEEQKDLFASGRRNLDSDWNTYLNELNRMGLQRWLEISQRAYTRTMSLF